MAQNRMRRIQKELEECNAHSPRHAVDTSVPSVYQLPATPSSPSSSSSTLQLVGFIPGPDDTPYAAGLFALSLTLDTTQYPFTPPVVTFITKIYHPNISSQTGVICLDVLKDAWSPVFTLKTVLLSIQSLLSDPVPTDPQDAQVAKHLMSDPAGFAQTAAEWTRLYAQFPASHYLPNGMDGVGEEVAMVDEAALVGMGFSRKQVRKALVEVEARQGDGSGSGSASKVERALELLLSS